MELGFMRVSLEPYISLSTYPFVTSPVPFESCSYKPSDRIVHYFNTPSRNPIFSCSIP
jgi:hypothetical protein